MTTVTSACRRVGALAIVLVLLLGCTLALAAPHDFIRAEGKRLVDGHGDTFSVKGINLGNWLFREGYLFRFEGRAYTPVEVTQTVEALLGSEQAERFWTEFHQVYIAKEDVAFIKAAGFNTVRVPLSWRLLAQENGAGNIQFQGPGWPLLDQLVQWCRDAGLRVIVDLHSAPGGQTGHTHDEGSGYPLTFYVPEYRRLTLALWQKLAEHYRDETAVLGYDLLNEPISPFSNMAYLNPRLEPLYRDVVATIRSVDRNHIVLLGGSEWETSFAVFGRPFDSNAVYAYHKFWFDPVPAAVREYVDFSNRWNVPVLITETGEYNDAWNARARALHEKFGIGWIFWTYKNMQSRLSVVTVQKPAGWDLVSKAAETNNTSLPPRQQAQAIFDAYLEAAKFKNLQINADYLHSLGLVVPGEAGSQ